MYQQVINDLIINASSISYQCLHYWLNCPSIHCKGLKYTIHNIHVASKWYTVHQENFQVTTILTTIQYSFIHAKMHFKSSQSKQLVGHTHLVELVFITFATIEVLAQLSKINFTNKVIMQTMNIINICANNNYLIK